MGELPKAGEWTALKELHDWQHRTRYNTASWEKPGVDSVEKYKGRWTDTNDIQIRQQLTQHFRPDNTNIIKGSPAASTIPEDAIVIVRNTEDAYKWKMRVRVVSNNIYTLKAWFDNDRYRNLIGSPLSVCPSEQTHVFVAYAHLWGQSDWQKLMNSNHTSYTLIGRLDQYPGGRGQTFRDMCESNTFDQKLYRHIGAEVVLEAQMDDISEITKKHQVVQCFYNSGTPPAIDTNRRQLTKPYRIRTLRETIGDNFHYHEEAPQREKGTNASVINVRNFKGIPVQAGIYICSEDTTSFDIHVARTHCLQALYIIGDTPGMFAFERRPPARNTTPW